MTATLAALSSTQVSFEVLQRLAGAQTIVGSAEQVAGHLMLANAATQKLTNFRPIEASKI
ncbi:hypothetical protein [Phyllobacterium endophyticum]|uniref:hypothetical protein n=1 Tax=Phyllobacterium endophyticum TaxID=1149773 RepID=UPI0011B26805|nr:hypothetical protein [Phyllobacterium endophyticum]MBB3236775.1 hypothetical protein [Phyllobacterium endophyticum]TYR40329.1 hypothetical protein FY050_17440 [Phyllobacterium endophyticum]